ncbi:MAG: 50S ribosomal protein L21 [Candidatus Chisholmbacteria bacterium]|nr:50S ribosomal protein L21 [Candidatus Chisholmbacteria bacterium]
MDYAIVKIQGHQYKVKTGDTLLLPRLDVKEQNQVSFAEVLLLAQGESVEIGKPYLKNVTVTAQVVDHLKGKKIRVATYKSKSRYRRVKGYRDHLTRVKITSIVGREKKKETKSESSPRKSASSRLTKTTK